MSDWSAWEQACQNCTKCGLSATRRHVVLERGSRSSRVMFIGEGPGEQEDRTGAPFVGKAGKLLDLCLEALDFPQEDIYIANIVKCRPPQNREPHETEAQACLPWLRAQVRMVSPKILVLLGGISLKYIAGPEFRITRDRGQWVDKGTFRVMPTFHPAAVLRDDTKRESMFCDLKKVRDALKEMNQ